MNADARELALAQLRQDPQYGRIAPARRSALVEAALDDGRLLARAVAATWGERPDAIAAACGIPVVHSDADADFGSTVVHAEYSTRPPGITLYRTAIARLLGCVQQAAMVQGLDAATLERLFIAHELYHHFDCLRGGQRIARRHRVKLFGVGRWQWTSGLASLAEVAAGAFAQRLLRLEFHPALLDLVLVGHATRNHPAIEEGP